MSENSIPVWPFRLLARFCPDHLYEEIEGDLIQKFNRDVDCVGKKKAQRRLVWNAIRFFRPGIILRNRFSFKNNRPHLYGNYLTTSLRYIKKNKVNFGFKLGGLSLAIFSFLAIAIYVNYQWSFDSYHSNYENIYRVNSQRKENGQVEKYAISPLAIGPMLKEHIPEIKAFVRVRFANITYLRHEENVIGCEGLIETDSSLFDVLTYRFIAGTPDALNKPYGIVLTKAKAIDLFGTTDVLGKVVTINNDKQPFEVTAVIEYPSNTCFSFNAAILINEEF